MDFEFCTEQSELQHRVRGLFEEKIDPTSANLDPPSHSQLAC